MSSSYSGLLSALERLCQLPALVHPHEDVAAAHKFALYEDLRAGCKKPFSPTTEITIAYPWPPLRQHVL